MLMMRVGLLPMFMYSLMLMFIMLQLKRVMPRVSAVRFVKLAIVVKTG